MFCREGEDSGIVSSLGVVLFLARYLHTINLILTYFTCTSSHTHKHNTAGLSTAAPCSAPAPGQRDTNMRCWRHMCRFIVKICPTRPPGRWRRTWFQWCRTVSMSPPICAATCAGCRMGLIPRLGAISRDKACHTGANIATMKFVGSTIPRCRRSCSYIETLESFRQSQSHAGQGWERERGSLFSPSKQVLVRAKAKVHSISLKYKTKEKVHTVS